MFFSSCFYVKYISCYFCIIAVMQNAVVCGCAEGVGVNGGIHHNSPKL